MDSEVAPWPESAQQGTCTDSAVRVGRASNADRIPAEEDGESRFRNPPSRAQVDLFASRQAEDVHGFLAAIMQSSQDAIVSKTLDGIITSWNQGAERLYGYTSAEAVGAPISLIVPAERSEELCTLMECVKHGRRVDRHETVRLRKDGSLVEVSVSLSPIRDSAGQIVAIAAVTRDLVEKKRAEQAIKEADRRNDDILAMLAHELRNPLVPLRSGLDLLALETRGRRDTLEWMQQQAEHLVRVVDELLDVSCLMHGKIRLRVEPVELRALLEHAVKSMRSTLQNRQQELILSLPEEAVWMQGDPVRLIQVIENLLGNASKFTDCGGRVELTAQRHERRVTITVADNGIGMDAELIPRVFELFTQADRSLDRSPGGLGVGLTLVRTVIEMHGGTVEAHSAGLGHGSAFVVCLPVTGPPPAEEARLAPATMPIARRVLIVEDHPGSARILARLLAKIGSHEVQVALNGPRALELARQFLPELVLLDIGLPGMSGYEVARCLRAQPHGEEVFLVALTGYAQEADRQHCWEAGFDEHLVKPPALDVLRELFNHPRLSHPRESPARTVATLHRP